MIGEINFSLFIFLKKKKKKKKFKSLTDMSYFTISSNVLFCLPQPFFDCST